MRLSDIKGGGRSLLISDELLAPASWCWGQEGEQSDGCRGGGACTSMFSGNLDLNWWCMM